MSSIESGYAEVNGTRLYYELTGEGEPLALIHGGYSDLRMWDYQIQDISKKHRLLRYDLRGHGKSSLPETNKRYSHHEDLKALLNHMKIPEAHICGHSFGCAIAADFTLSYPEMCSSIIAAGPFIFGYSSPKTTELISHVNAVESLFKEKGKEVAINHFYSFFHYGQPDVLEHMKKISLDYSFWEVLNDDPMDVVHPYARDRVDEITVPTLIISSDHDVDACGEIADFLELQIPNSKKVVISDAGHDMNLDQPSEFNEIVLNFIESL